MLCFFQKNKILSDSQFGFRKNYSTELAIVEMIRKVGVAADRKEYAAGIFLDLTKAFDCIDHEILLRKLDHYGVRGRFHNLLRSYLNDRVQYVKWNGKESTKTEINLGVPQGSIIGPLLFLIYINDLPNSSHLFDFIMYADDVNLITCGKDITELLDKTNEEMEKVSNWFINNKLTLNKKNHN